jgi:hypothetical protein
VNKFRRTLEVRELVGSMITFDSLNLAMRVHEEHGASESEPTLVDISALEHPLRKRARDPARLIGCKRSTTFRKSRRVMDVQC